ncbi:MAG: hypothetical protein QM731_10360 [Chitinophagaceae bacterium]
MLNRLFIVVCLLPKVLLAQKAPNTLPENNPIKDTARQRDLLDVARSVIHINPKKIREERERKVYFSILPFGDVPGGTGRALMTSTTVGMYLGSKATTNKSSATFAPYWNFKKRFGLPLRTNIWLPNNKWYIQGDIRFLKYPQYTWGIGNDEDFNNKILVNYYYIRFYQAALKRITPHFYIGAGYRLDYRFNINSDDTARSLKFFTGYDYGTGSQSFASGVTLNLLYDTRNKDIYPFPGWYANLVYRVDPFFLGNSSNWHSLNIDVRKYFSLNRLKPNQQNTLAFWTYFWTTLNNGVPYLDLPSTGWDSYNRSARGVDQNRYRGKSLFYFETEYRRDITRDGLLGFVIFGNVNTVSGNGSLFSVLHPAGGTGIRIKFSKVSNTNLGIDVGVSKGYQAIIVNLSEAF